MVVLSHGQFLLTTLSPQTWYIPRRHFLIHDISSEWTTKMYINFFNQFFIIFYLNIAPHNLGIELCRALKTFWFLLVI